MSQVTSKTLTERQRTIMHQIRDQIANLQTLLDELSETVPTTDYAPDPCDHCGEEGNSNAALED